MRPARTRRVEMVVRETCPVCEGEGIEQVRSYGRRHGQECEHCGGSGVVEKDDDQDDDDDE
jgi:DnaJ-class molecular chaperone